MSDGHLLPDQLAEHAEGLFAPEDARTADDHLRRCAECRETVAALQAVSSRLAAVPKSVPTPPDVAARVDRALAAERTERPKAAPAGLLERLRARLPVLAAAAAGAAVLGFAGWVVGTSGLGGNDADMESAADAPQQAEQNAAGESLEAPEEAAAEPEGDAGAGGRGESTDELSADAAPAPEDAAALADRAALTDQVLAIARRADAGSEGSGPDETCGSRLAAEQQEVLVGTAPARLGADDDAGGAVLVVLETAEADVVRGWVLPSCDAGADDALAPALTVPVE